MTSPSEFGGYGGGGTWGGTGTRPGPAHLRITFSGTLGPSPGALEVWGFNFSARHGANSALGSEAARTALATLAQTLVARWTTFSFGIGNQCRLTRVRVASLGSEGTVDKTGGGAFVQGDAPANQLAGGTFTGMPFQIAMAVSTMTARSGAGGRGRFYVPVPIGTLDGSGLLATADQNSATTRAKAFLDGINTDLAAGSWGRLVVASGGSIPKGLPASLSDITGIRVGRVMDTMRSRRSALPESYSVASLA